MKLAPRSKLAAKLAISLGLLAWLVVELDTRRIVRSLTSADPALLGGAFVLVCGDNLLRSFNWRLLLGTGEGDGPRFVDVLTSFLVGGFFGFFLPSSLGPDAARTVSLSSRTGIGATRAASSVVMLNLIGLWALAVVFLAGSAVLLSLGAVPAGVWGIAGLAGVGVVLLPALLATRAPLPDLRASSTIGRRLMEFVRALARYRSAGRRLWPIFALALVNQVLAVLVVFTVFRAGGIDVAPVYFLALVPLVHVSRLIPASVAGFGAEQGVVVGLFSLAGVEPAAALAMSVLVSGLNLGVQLLTGVVYAGASARSLGRDLTAGTGADPGRGGRAPNSGPGGPRSADEVPADDPGPAREP